MVGASSSGEACAPTCGLKLLFRCRLPDVDVVVVVGQSQELTPRMATRLAPPWLNAQDLTPLLEIRRQSPASWKQGRDVASTT